MCNNERNAFDNNADDVDLPEATEACASERNNVYVEVHSRHSLRGIRDVVMRGTLDLFMPNNNPHFISSSYDVCSTVSICWSAKRFMCTSSDNSLLLWMSNAFDPRDAKIPQFPTLVSINFEPKRGWLTEFSLCLCETKLLYSLRTQYETESVQTLIVSRSYYQQMLWLICVRALRADKQFIAWYKFRW